MQSWALVVGINQYPGRAAQKPLEGAVADACDFAEWAIDPAGGRVPLENLFFWTNPWPDPVPAALLPYVNGTPPEWYADAGDDIFAPVDRTRAPKAIEVIRTAERVGYELRAARLEDPDFKARIFVFLAGHGLRTAIYKEDKKQTCFLCEDFKAEEVQIAGGLIPCESFRRSLRNNRFDEVLFFLDCCRTDPSTLTLKAQPLCDLTSDQEPEGWATGHAAHQEGRAYETNGDPVRGAFSQTVMNGLRGHRGPNGTLDASQLDDYVRRNIGACTTMPQEPYFDFLPKSAPPILARFEATLKLPDVAGPVVRLAALQEGETLELVTSDDVVTWEGGPFAAGTTETALPELPDGMYGLRVAGQPGREVLFRHPGTEAVDVKGV